MNITFETSPAMHRRALILLLFVTVIWGGTFIWMKMALNALEVEIDAYGITTVVFTLIAARFLIAIIALLSISRDARASLRDAVMWKKGAMLGGLMFAGFALQMVGLDDVNPATSAFLTSMDIVLVALLSTYFAGLPITRGLALGVVLATIGAGFIDGPPHLTWGRGEFLTLLGAVIFAFHIMLIQDLTQKYNPLGITQISFVVVFIACLVPLPFLAPNLPSAMWDIYTTKGVLVPLVCLGLFGSFLALVLLNTYQRHLHPVQASIIYTFEPVWATIFGLTFAFVPWSLWIAFGGLAIFIGNLVVEVSSHKDDDDATISTADEVEEDD
ncbi:MAG: DMT family transporter [Candidatus Poseidoniales archaeon]